MQLPTISLNGTSPNQLLRDYNDVRETLNIAIDTMRRCAPHLRDYYVKEGDFKAACTEHDKRLNSLVTILYEVNQIAEHISDHL